MLVIARLRRWLLLIAAVICAGVVAELWLTGHHEYPLQWVPLILCALGALLYSFAAFAPNTANMRLVQVLALFSLLGGALGVLVHLQGNLAFATEIDTARAASAPLAAALFGGNPPLAPGAVSVAGLTALAGATR